MSVPDQETAFFYTANGVTTTFAYGFYLLSLDDIQVSLDGVVQTSGFTVNGIGSQTGGAVIFSSAPDSGVTVLIERAVAIERESDFQPNGDLRSDVLNNEFDRIWMALQDKKRENVRSLRYPTFENLDGTLPVSSARTNMLLGFSATGIHTLIPLPSSIGAGDIVPNTFTSGVDFTPDVTTQLTLSRAPGGNGNLEVFFDGIFQGFDQWNVSGTTLTFTSPIPTGVGKVFVRIGTTLSTEIPPDQSVTDEKVATGTKLYTRITDLPFITDGNLVLGDGSTDDAAGMLARFNAENGRAIIFPARTYFLGSDVNAPAGSRARFQKGVAFAGPGKLKNVLVEYEQGNATAVIGSKMKIDYLTEKSDSAYKLADLAGIWPGGEVRTLAGFSHTYTATEGSGVAPLVSLFSYANNDGAPGDVCAGLDVSYITPTAGGSKAVFGRNIIAGAWAGVTNAKMVGLEIDIEPSLGVTSSGAGAGIYINGFNATNLGPAMQVGGISGAAFTNGILFGAVSGAMLAMQAGNTGTSFIDTSPGSFTGQAINLGVNHTITFRGPANSVAATMNGDSSGNLAVGLGQAAMIVSGSNTTEGSALMQVRDSGGIAALQVFVARGAGPNAANAAIKVNGQSVTSRSINAGGTINASGADYAEYEFKREDCGVIAKGQIVGFDADGQITDRFSMSVSFGIKSTAPNLVGGDTWGGGAGPEPVAPAAPDEPGQKPVKTETLRYEKFKRQIDDEHDAAVKAWEKRVAKYETEKARYEEAYADHAAAHAKWEQRLEAARAKVDRIAYCGKVPVNVTGAAVGQHVVPVAGPDDSITAVLIDDEAITFAQYRAAVGRVRRILEDGRAEVVVKPI